MYLSRHVTTILFLFRMFSPTAEGKKTEFQNSVPL